MKRFVAFLCSVTFVLSVAGIAMAVPITGEISFAGLVTPTGGTGLGDATALDFPSFLVVAGASGDFSGALGESVAFSSFSFSPFSASIEPLWAIPGTGTVVYSFDLDSLNIMTQENNFLNLSGAGTLHIIGFDDTPGTWTFTSTSANNSIFSFVSNTAAPVPEPATMLLVGTGLAGLAGLRRRFRE